MINFTEIKDILKHILSSNFVYKTLYFSIIIAISSYYFPTQIKKMMLSLNQLSLEFLEQPFKHINETMIINLWSGISIIQIIMLIISIIIITLGNINFFNINPYKGGNLLYIVIILWFTKVIIINLLFFCTNIQIIDLEFITILPLYFKIGDTKIDEIVQGITILENCLIFIVIYSDLKFVK